MPAIIDRIGPRAQLYDDLVILDPMTARSQTKPQPKTDRGERTRQKILAAAGSEIGRRGFSVTSISDITSAAGVGQGTFYIYFQSKEDVLRELVLQMGRELRQHLSDATTGAKTRLDAEREGLLAFIEFVRSNPGLYRIVEESQFVDEAVYRRYYMDFAATYRAALQAAEARGEISRGSAEVRAWALMGMAVFLGQRYGLWDVATPLEDVVGPAVDLIGRGMQP
jgi:AcrR family transcriptional regulator